MQLGAWVARRLGRLARKGGAGSNYGYCPPTTTTTTTTTITTTTTTPQPPGFMTGGAATATGVVLMIGAVELKRQPLTAGSISVGVAAGGFGPAPS